MVICSSSQGTSSSNCLIRLLGSPFCCCRTTQYGFPGRSPNIPSPISCTAIPLGITAGTALKMFGSANAASSTYMPSIVLHTRGLLASTYQYSRMLHLEPPFHSVDRVFTPFVPAVLQTLIH